MTHSPRANRGVDLPEGRSGSSFLYELLRHAVDAFPDALKGAGLPADAKRFKDAYGAALVRFEAARVVSPQRVDIALAIRRHAAAQLRFVDASGARPFAEVMSQPAAAATWKVHSTRGPGRLDPVVTAGGVRYAAGALRRWLADGVGARVMTDPARLAVERLLDRAAADGGTLSLSGERFALLGAGAELAPTRALLAAGASVLWIDLRPPPDALLQASDLGGALYVPDAPSNLLSDPMGIAAIVRRFVEEGPAHVGMYAYAGGESQEWRLTASMNAILRTLPASAVRSVALLISPTTVAVASADDVAVSRARRAAAPLWTRALGRAGLLQPAGVDVPGGRVVDTIVPLQGASYQAAQYVGKVLSAETHAAYGPGLAEAGAPLTVSANTAPITNTRSLSHPLFQAGFLAAPRWGITIAEPVTTTQLSGLLMISDVTDPSAPCAGGRSWPTPAARAANLFTEAVHGGLFAQPYAAYGEIQVAAATGLTQKPSLLVDLVRGRH